MCIRHFTCMCACVIPIVLYTKHTYSTQAHNCAVYKNTPK